MIDMDTAVALREMGPVLVVPVVIFALAWVIVTTLKVRHGYPLGGDLFGRASYPHSGKDTDERVALLTAETAQLRAELSAVKDRLATVERIVTDGAYRLDREIDALRAHTN